MLEEDGQGRLGNIPSGLVINYLLLLIYLTPKEKKKSKLKEKKRRRRERKRMVKKDSGTSSQVWSYTLKGLLIEISPCLDAGPQIRPSQDHPVILDRVRPVAGA